MGEVRQLVPESVREKHERLHSVAFNLGLLWGRSDDHSIRRIICLQKEIDALLEALAYTE